MVTIEDNVLFTDKSFNKEVKVKEVSITQVIFVGIKDKKEYILIPYLDEDCIEELEEEGYENVEESLLPYKVCINYEDLGLSELKSLIK